MRNGERFNEVPAAIAYTGCSHVHTRAIQDTTFSNASPPRIKLARFSFTDVNRDYLWRRRAKEREAGFVTREFLISNRETSRAESFYLREIERLASFDFDSSTPTTFPCRRRKFIL